MVTRTIRNRRWRIVGIAAAFAFIAALVGVQVTQAHVDGKINVVDTEGLEQPKLSAVQPEKVPATPDDELESTKIAEGTQNYMVIGSDSRSGAAWEKGGARSDTTLIVHVSADRKRVDLVSIPRDSIVDIPACSLSSGGKTSPEADGMFNSAFTRGDSLASSVACTRSTIERNTELKIDGFVVVDFSGFEEIVDSLGGVKMNIPNDMKSEKANLDLKKGTQTLDGKDALAYARARTLEVGEADGSDIARIDRQHELLEAIVTQTLSKDTLTSPRKLYSVINSLLASASFSEGLGSSKALAGAAYELKDIDSENINFYTVPVKESPQDPNRVVWTQEAESYWKALREDHAVDSQ